MDFTDGVSIYGRLASELAQLDVGVLINNVGMSNDGPEPYAEHVEQLVPDLINCNIMSIDISLVVEKTQESLDSENEEVDIDRNKFFSPGILY